MIAEILDPDSDLNTRRLEHIVDDEQLVSFFGQSSLENCLRKSQTGSICQVCAVYCHRFSGNHILCICCCVSNI